MEGYILSYDYGRILEKPMVLNFDSMDARFFVGEVGMFDIPLIFCKSDNRNYLDGNRQHEL